MSDEKKLEPCPFCGLPPEEVVTNDNIIVVACNNGCGASGPFMDDTQDRLKASDYAVEQWNTRTAPPHHITVTIDTRTHRVVEKSKYQQALYLLGVQKEDLDMLHGIRESLLVRSEAIRSLLAAAPSHGEDKG